MRRKFTINTVHINDDKPDEELVIQSAYFNISAAGDNEVVAAVPGRKIRVVGLKFRSAGTVTLTPYSGTGVLATKIDCADSLKEGWGFSDCWAPHGYFHETKVGEALNYSLSDAVAVAGTLNYVEV